jgi:glycerol-3-phosphate dehydrogenase
MSSSHLNAVRRVRELDELASSTVDVLVIGGGITGCGIALDAASRGLSVALVEKDDLAFGTSRWSSKLVHGGLRYLATGDVGIAMESARERGILMTRTAPHLVRALPMVVPLSRDVSARDGLLVEAGHRSADLLRLASRTPRATLPRPRRIGIAETTRLLPGVRREGLRGASLNWDGHLEDDARLVVAIARTAAAHGARILTRVLCPRQRRS